MHALFSDWYQVIDPLAPRETIEKRWAATEECLEGLDMGKVAELATYVALVQPQTLSWFRAVYKKHDDVMKTRGVDEEIRLLAAVVLRVAIEREDDLAVLSALCLLTGVFGRSDQPKWLEEHLNEAARTLAAMGRSVREFAETGEISSTADGDEHNRFLEATVAMIKTLRESNDFLWWAFTGHSLTLGESYSGLSGPTLAVTAPADLIGFSRMLPLSAEAETLLLHVVMERAELDAKYSFKAYASSLTRAQAQKLARPVPAKCQLLCPILWVLQVSSEGKAWQTEFERLFKIKTSTPIPMPAFTLQFLRELCLLRSTHAEQGVI